MIAVYPSAEGTSVLSADSVMARLGATVVTTTAGPGTNLPEPAVITTPSAPSFVDQIMDFAMARHGELLRKLAD